MRLLLLALLLAPLAAAQPMTPDASPAAGTLTPQGEAATLTFEVRTSMEAPSDLADEGCVGYIDPSAPDAVVTWGGGDLRIWMSGDFDATMLVSTPDGDWMCNDDDMGLLPAVNMMNAAAGRYAVWVGSFAPDPLATDVTLYAGTPPPPPVLNVDGTPLVGEIQARGGFEASQGLIEVMAEVHGEDRADDLDLSSFQSDDYCTGYIDADQPTAAVNYSADGGTGTLALGAVSSNFDDLVLVVLGPDGEVHCNDDYNGPDPVVVVEDAPSGRYLLWPGTFSTQTEPVDAMLTVAESAEEIEFMDDFGGDLGDDSPFSPYSEGTYVLLDLDTVPSVRLTAGTESSSSVGAQITPETGNPVQGPSCTGFIERAATVAIELSGDGPFALTASSETDLTLTVRTPSGQWFCSDDADSLDPGIQIDTVEDGFYHAWVGTFSDFGETTDVTVSAEQGEIEVNTGFGGGPSYGGPTQTEGMYAGTEIQAGQAGVILSLGGEAPLTETVMAGGPVLNPVDGDACQGFVSMRPTATIESLHPEIEVSASTNDDDLTLVVLAPDGSWTCSDDADGSDPRVTASGGTGDYSVWVGTFSRRMEAPEAILTVDLPSLPPPPPAPEVIRG